MYCQKLLSICSNKEDIKLKLMHYYFMQLQSSEQESINLFDFWSFCKEFINEDEALCLLEKGVEVGLLGYGYLCKCICDEEYYYPMTEEFINREIECGLLGEVFVPSSKQARLHKYYSLIEKLPEYDCDLDLSILIKRNNKKDEPVKWSSRKDVIIKELF